MKPGPCADNAAWAKLDALQKPLGITRVADITGLDCLGLPVVQVVRPFSRSNAVSQGKGETLYAASRSAIMESAESFFAERIERFPTTITSAKRLAIDPVLYASHVDPEIRHQWIEWDLAWTPATNLLGGTQSLVPLEMLHTAYVLPPPDYDGVFQTSTTGLAVAEMRDIATRHGLLECIERDALARALLRHGALQDFRFDPVRLKSPALDKLVAALQSKGFLVGLWLLPSVGDCPVVWCHLMEDCEMVDAVLPQPAEGAAARLNVAEAAIAAIHEAAQSRLTVIAGARDDIGTENYTSMRGQTKRDAHRQLLKQDRHMVVVENLPNHAKSDAKAEVDCLLSLLQENGFTDVYAIELETDPLPQLHAVKIIVPCLEPLREG